MKMRVVAVLLSVHLSACAADEKLYVPVKGMADADDPKLYPKYVASLETRIGACLWYSDPHRSPKNPGDGVDWSGRPDKPADYYRCETVREDALLTRSLASNPNHLVKRSAIDGMIHCWDTKCEWHQNRY